VPASTTTFAYAAFREPHLELIARNTHRTRIGIISSSNSVNAEAHHVGAWRRFTARKRRGTYRGAAGIDAVRIGSSIRLAEIDLEKSTGGFSAKGTSSTLAVGLVGHAEGDYSSMDPRAMTTQEKLWLASFCAAATAISSCSLLLGTESVQCKSDADCNAHGLAGSTCVSNVCVTTAADSGVDMGADVPVDTGPVDPKWGCLGSVKWEPSDPTKTIQHRERFVEALSEAPVVGMVVKDCPPLDVNCTASTHSATTDDAGYMTITLAKSFSGYLQLTPAAGSLLLPSLTAVNPPPTIDSDLDAELPVPQAAHMLQQDQLDAMLALIGSKTDPKYGHILGIVLDCAGQPTSDVSILIGTKTDQTISYYTDSSGTPSLTLTQTGPRGEAGFVNLPTGPATVTATANSVSKRHGSYTVLVKPGQITFLPMPPSP
jgi:hypothetical protein